MAIHTRNGRHPRQKISAALTAPELDALDAYAERQGATRTEVVAAAITHYLAAAADEDLERATRIDELERKLDRTANRLAGIGSNAEIAALMSVEALRQSSQRVQGIGLDGLRQKAVNLQRNRAGS